jgi:hypothetical protein
MTLQKARISRLRCSLLNRHRPHSTLSATREASPTSRLTPSSSSKAPPLHAGKLCLRILGAGLIVKVKDAMCQSENVIFNSSLVRLHYAPARSSDRGTKDRVQARFVFWQVAQAMFKSLAKQTFFNSTHNEQHWRHTRLYTSSSDKIVLDVLHFAVKASEAACWKTARPDIPPTGVPRLRKAAPLVDVAAETGLARYRLGMKY